jgi:hypothetical protein
VKIPPKKCRNERTLIHRTALSVDVNLPRLQDDRILCKQEPLKRLGRFVFCMFEPLLGCTKCDIEFMFPFIGAKMILNSTSLWTENYNAKAITSTTLIFWFLIQKGEILSDFRTSEMKVVTHCWKCPIKWFNFKKNISWEG